MFCANNLQYVITLDNACLCAEKSISLVTEHLDLTIIVENCLSSSAWCSSTETPNTEMP